MQPAVKRLSTISSLNTFQGALIKRALTRMSTRTIASTREKEKTFQYQDSLPSLPVPPLEQTCRKYLESVKPFLSEAEYLQTDFIVKEFQHGVGKDLQKILEERGRTRRNWLAQFWEEEAYLRPRYPMAPLVNIGGPILIPDKEMWKPEEGTQIKRSALYVHESLKICQRIYRQEFEVQRIGGKPLCMDQYTKVYSFCRTPGEKLDKIQSYFKLAPAPIPRHIVVMVKGRIFHCTVLDQNYEPFTPPEIERALNQIVDMAESKPYGPAIGSLTSAERTTWYQLRERLKSLDTNNVKYLRDIEQSLFILVLDDHCLQTEYEQAFHSFAGDCKNRWFDKSLILLAFKSGLFSTHADHVPFEGIVSIDVNTQTGQAIASSEGEWKGRMDIRNSVTPHELKFTVDDKIMQGVDKAIKTYEQTVSNIDYLKCEFDEYGKNFSKTQKIHPDTFCQVVIQLTYFRMHKKPAPTYETAQTRKFYHGRTDTVRSCTSEAVAFCEAMLDSNYDVNAKAQLFRQACAKHSQLMAEAVDGNAIDRHFLGLSVIARDEGYPTPPIFLDKAWPKSGGGANFVVSTSCVGFASPYGLVVPMVHDGYGVFYSIENARFNVLITVWKDSSVTDVRRFHDELVRSFQDVRQVLLASKL